VSTTEEGGQEEGGDAVIGGLRICLAMEGDGLIGSSTSCDHKVGKEAGMEDSGQQI
jgi:hypothetical protein